MIQDKEHPGVLVYALVFFLLLTLVSYLLLQQYLEADQVSQSQPQLISPALDINDIFK